MSHIFIDIHSCMSCRRSLGRTGWRDCSVNPSHAYCSSCWDMWMMVWSKPPEEEGHFPIIPCPCKTCSVDCIRDEYKLCRASIITMSHDARPPLTYGLTAFTSYQMIVSTRRYLKERVADGYKVESVSIYNPGQGHSAYPLDAITIEYFLSDVATYYEYGQTVACRKMESSF